MPDARSIPPTSPPALGELDGRRILVTTPVHLRTLLADGAAVPPLDFILCATAPLAPQLATDAEIRLSAPLHEIYGCSETGQLAVRRTRATAEWQCIDGIRLRQDVRGTWASGDFLDGETLLADVIELNARGPLHPSRPLGRSGQHRRQAEFAGLSQPPSQLDRRRPRRRLLHAGRG